MAPLKFKATQTFFRLQRSSRHCATLLMPMRVTRAQSRADAIGNASVVGGGHTTAQAVAAGQSSGVYKFGPCLLTEPQLAYIGSEVSLLRWRWSASI